MIKSLLLSKYLKRKLKYILILLLGFGYYNSISQNLIANGSFENYTAPVNCTGGGGGFDNYTAFPVNHVVNNWYSLNSPDYFSQLCNGSNNNGSPTNLFGCNYANEGNNYAGFILFTASYETKEYIYQQLSNPLQAGKLYCMSFYVSRADLITHAIHSIGAFFSNNIQSTTSLGYVNATPQIVNQSGFITDTIGWTEIQGCFTANGGEQYVTIGNFNSNTDTDTLFVGSANPLSGANCYAYYYIDNITLIDQSTVGVSELVKENSFEVYPNPNNGIMQLNYNISKKAELLITDITGRVVNSYPLDETQRSIVINEQGLNAGIYFYTIKQNNHILKQDKIVIIK
jgi:hypothetical protein